jgi:hypothetical protein
MDEDWGMWLMWEFRTQSAKDDDSIATARVAREGDSAAHGAGPGRCAHGMGRPFLVRGEPRLAPICARHDWETSSHPDVDLPMARRTELGRRWAEVGRMEHASVAAFARFALELLAFGTPAELLCDCQQAMADEILHAKIAFGFATAYGNEPVGPDALSIEGALAAPSLGESLTNALLEGCIGETVAAIEAREAAALAGDPVVKNALERIAIDEMRHAALAWRFVRFALDKDSALSIVIEHTLSQARLNAQVQCSNQREANDVWLWRHGFVPEADRAALRLEVLRNVVEPCAGELTRAAARRAKQKRWQAA